MRIYTKIVLQMTDDPEVYIPIQSKFYEYEGPIARADRSVQGSANQNARTAGAIGAGYGANAGADRSTLFPTLRAEASGEMGLTPQQQANELTAGEQATGGTTGSIAGQATLNAERTRNSGATAGILDEAVRRAAQTLSGNAVGVQNKSADIARQRQATALGQLQGLYGTDVSSQLKAMGLQNEDLDTAINAGKSGWVQNATGIIGALNGAGKAGSFTL